MILSLPEEVERQLTPEDAKLHLAIGLFLDRRVTLGQAAEVAGLAQTELLRELGSRRIPIHYDEADAEADVRFAKQWSK